MAKKKTKKVLIPKALFLALIVTGISTFILQILNRWFKLFELNEITGLIGSTFIIVILLIIGILLFNWVNNK